MPKTESGSDCLCAVDGDDVSVDEGGAVGIRKKDRLRRLRGVAQRGVRGHAPAGPRVAEEVRSHGSRTIRGEDVDANVAKPALIASPLRDDGCRSGGINPRAPDPSVGGLIRKLQLANRPERPYSGIMSDADAEEIVVLESELVHMARLMAAGNGVAASALLRKLARKYKKSAPNFARAIVEALRAGPVRSAATPVATGQPLDTETRLPLVREEHPVVLINEPILDDSVESALRQIVEEHRHSQRLLEAGLAPTRTALLVGAPGVGKTLAARWIARELGLPLLVLDLSSVMSSFLGRTGVNVRRVLDYARSVPAVLLLDELDAVAKRRDDATEIGELKRLVTVLLQEIDSWPDGALLLAATNHSELLDPAVWRRFEIVLDFPKPDQKAMEAGIRAFLDEPGVDGEVVALIARLYDGENLSRLERDVFRARRAATMSDSSPVDALVVLAKDRFARLPASVRGPAAARLLAKTGLSQRAVHDLTGVSRDTLRKYSAMTTGGTDAK